MRRVLALPMVTALVAGLFSGCLYTRHQTHSARSATEQLLLTESAERAVSGLALPEVEGKAVAVETISLAGADADYVRSVVERRLGAAGARVTPTDLAELLFVVQVGAFGTAGRDMVFGVPSVPLPGGAATPSLPLFRVLKQRGYTKLRLLTRDASGGFIAQSEPAMERASFEVYGFLFLVLRRNDIYPGEALELAID